MIPELQLALLSNWLVKNVIVGKPAFFNNINETLLSLKREPIPVFKRAEMDKHHFRDTEWKPLLAGTSNFFHINRIEDYIHHLKLPLPPHRKTVYDLIFLSHGHSVRTKGLDRDEIHPNPFFFLPSYQITTHEAMTPEATGFYCHFNEEILIKYYKQDQLLLRQL